MIQFVCTCHFGCLHFEQSHEERKRRFSSLIFIHAIWVKPIFASACHYIVKRNLEVVLSEKPTKGPVSFLKPLVFFRQLIYL